MKKKDFSNNIYVNNPNFDNKKKEANYINGEFGSENKLKNDHVQNDKKTETRVNMKGTNCLILLSLSLIYLFFIHFVYFV